MPEDVNTSFENLYAGTPLRCADRRTGRVIGERSGLPVPVNVNPVLLDDWIYLAGRRVHFGCTGIPYTGHVYQRELEFILLR